MDKRVEITANDIPISNVLDQYYHFLKEVIANTKDRIYLFNTITPFDAYETSPLYNENVFANWADSVVGTSPKIIDDSQGISFNDTFSRYYTEVVTIANKKIDKKHLTPEQRTEIKSLENDIDSLRDKAWNLDDRLAARWKDHAEKQGLKVGTFEYDVEKINLYTNSGLGTQLADIATDILAALAEIQEIKTSTYPPEYGALIRVHRVLRSKEFKMFRPFRPQLETSEQVSHWQLVKLLASSRNTIGLHDIVEENEQILPSADLSVLFKDASRGFKIKKDVKDIEEHDKDWSVSGSGSRFKIFKASASASYKEEIEESIKSMNEIGIDFKSIDEIRVNRRDWYDKSIFGLDVVKETLKENKRLATFTRYAVTSLIIGRGISLSFKFTENKSYEKMTDFKSSVSGKATIGFVSFGLSGHYNKHDFKQEKNDIEKSITFSDDVKVCRLLAMRFSQIHDEGSDRDFFNTFNYETEYDPKTKAFMPLYTGHSDDQ